jgi:hypothetical protein
MSAASLPLRSLEPARPRPWVRACLWLLLALLPLRGLASVEMLALSAAGPLAVHASSLAGMPVCHGVVTHRAAAVHAPATGGGLVAAAHAEAQAQGDLLPSAAADPSCAWSLVCAPALPGADAAMPGLQRAGEPSPTHRAGPALDVVPEPLFKPPRG